ncbi:hypothetical protein FOL47_004358, partial [Perkinsus chesapeaki]
EIRLLLSRRSLSEVLLDKVVIKYLHDGHTREGLLRGSAKTVSPKFLREVGHSIPEGTPIDRCELQWKNDRSFTPGIETIHTTIDRNVSVELAVSGYNSQYRVFTDGSVCKRSGTAGSAMVVLDHNDEIVYFKKWRMPHYASISQCEMFALGQAYNFAAARGERMIIFTDSYSCMLAICSSSTRFSTRSIRDNIIKVGKRVDLYWIPSHSEPIYGNILADKLANEARLLSDM